MRYIPAFIALLGMTADAGAVMGAGAVTTQPATTQSAMPQLAEPSSDHRFPGRVFTLHNLENLPPLQNIVVTNSLNARPTAGNGDRIDASNLEAILQHSTPLAPGDPLLDEWAYAPWCHATFEAHGGTWSVTFFLGGLGLITDATGRRGAFRFTPPKAAD